MTDVAVSYGESFVSVFCWAWPRSSCCFVALETKRKSGWGICGSSLSVFLWFYVMICPFICTGQLSCVPPFSPLMSLSGPCHRAFTATLEGKKKPTHLHIPWRLKSTIFQARTILMPMPSVAGPTAAIRHAIFFLKTGRNSSFQPCGTSTDGLFGIIVNLSGLHNENLAHLSKEVTGASAPFKRSQQFSPPRSEQPLQRKGLLISLSHTLVSRAGLTSSLNQGV